VRVSSQGGKRSGAPGSEPGNGLAGMRERVEALQGTLSAGPDAGDTWLVECRLPEATR